MHIKKGEIFEYKLPISLRMDQSRYLQRGIEISSTRNISLFCLNRQGYAYADGYLALPSKMLGLIYVVASYQPYRSRASIAVISAHDNNTIIVLLNEHAVVYYRGQRYDDSTSLSYITQVLNKLEALYIYGDSDLSGTIVIARKPVTVLSSVDFVRISEGEDFMETLLLPVSLWEYEYILTTVGTMNGKQGDIFRIFAYENNTVVQTGYWTKVLSSRMYAELVLGEDLASFAKCSKPCQVVQYIRQKNTRPSMIILPSVNQFLSYYQVILPYGSEYHDSITITIDNKHIDGLYMNGLALKSLRWKSINGTNYVWSVVSLSDPSTVTVYHNSFAVKFGLLVLCWKSGSWYAYPGGFAFGNYSSGMIFYFMLIYDFFIFSYFPFCFILKLGHLLRLKVDRFHCTSLRTKRFLLEHFSTMTLNPISSHSVDPPFSQKTVILNSIILRQIFSMFNDTDIHTHIIISLMQTDQFILTSLSFKKVLLCLNHFVFCNLRSGKQGKVQIRSANC